MLQTRESELTRFQADLKDKISAQLLIIENKINLIMDHYSNQSNESVILTKSFMETIIQMPLLQAERDII